MCSSPCISGSPSACISFRNITGAVIRIRRRSDPTLTSTLSGRALLRISYDPSFADATTHPALGDGQPGQFQTTPEGGGRLPLTFYRDDKEEHIICIHCPDYPDLNELMRVRERLRDLGVTKGIPFKTDDVTGAGKGSSLSMV